jgi:cell pole-organizing protein PopZ
MAKAAASAEPSMEEILATIRRIIADEPDGKEAAPKAAPAKAAPKPEVETMAEPAPDDEHISEEDLDKLFAQSGDDDEAEPEIDVDDADEPEVLDLSDVATVDDDGPLELVEGLKEDEAEVAFAEPTPEPVRKPEPFKAEAPRARPAPESEVEPEEPLVSAAATASVQSAFGQLSHTVLAANARTLDDLVKEMLRPMLRGWLDENLPVIVERLVRAEIERVSRGR